MTYWGVVILGLAMSCQEMPPISGLLCLENPELGTSGDKFSTQYTLEEIAELHFKRLKSLFDQLERPFEIIGMSMGGMIVSILASKYAAELPPDTRFRFLVTSPNLTENRAIPDALLAGWMNTNKVGYDYYAEIMAPFFSEDFRKAHPEKAEAYYRYRGNGENKQSPKAFMRQLTALRSFDGKAHFPKIPQEHSVFIGGCSDYILGPTHNQDLKALTPHATHYEVGTGHMINIEKPEYFGRKVIYDQTSGP